MNKDLIKLLPNDLELARLSKQLKKTLTSREELLSQVGTLNLAKMELEEKMVYVVGLISLGFDVVRARKRLGVKNTHFYVWKELEGHKEMLESAQARGEMVLEEKVLLEAEKNPEMAFKVLREKQRREERFEDKEVEEKRSIMDMMSSSGVERGIIQEGELIDDVLV